MRPGELIRQLIVPTPVQWIVSVSGAVAIFIFTQHQKLIEAIADATGTSRADLTAGSLQQLEAVTHIPYSSEIGIGIFWAAVGLLIYFFTLGTANAIANFQNFIVVETTYTDRSGLSRAFINIAFRCLAIAVVIACIAAAYFVVLPGIAWLWDQLFVDASIASKIGEGVVGVAAVALTIYVIWMLIVFTAVMQPARWLSRQTQ